MAIMETLQMNNLTIRDNEMLQQPNIKNALVDLSSENFEQAYRLAEIFSKSNLVPKEDIGKPENIIVKWQYGYEIGLSPMQSLRSICLINGRTAIYGDAMLALSLQHKDCVDVNECITGTGESLAAKCIVKRSNGRSDVVRFFSITDAKRAGLWGKAGPWTQYPQRMLQMRARSFALRDSFPDAFNGLLMAEEAFDIDQKTSVLPNNNFFAGRTEPQPGETIIEENTECSSVNPEIFAEYRDKLLLRLQSLGFNADAALVLCKKDSIDDFNRDDLISLLNAAKMIERKETTAEALLNTSPVVNELINDILKAN